MGFSNIIKALMVRLVLQLHNILSVWRVTVVWNNQYLWLLLLANIPFIIEGFYTIIKKRGIEWKWLCPCFLFFLMSTMPAIWLLEINRQGSYAAINITAVEDINIGGVKIPIRLNTDTWVLIIEECLLYFMILGRWFLPRGDVSREQLSQLLFSFIAIASDIMELFSLFDEDVIRSDIVITYVLLSIWTWSILQFALVLTVYSRPRRGRVTEKAIRIENEQKESVRLEIVAIFISIFMQDGPFLCLRMYCLIMFQLASYSLVFFTAKNLLVILLLVYRLSILCANNYCCVESKKKKVVEQEKYIAGDFPMGLEFELDYDDYAITKTPFRDDTVASLNHGFRDDKSNGGDIRQRSRPESVKDKLNGDVVVPPLSKQNSAMGSDSIRSNVTEVELLPNSSPKEVSLTRRSSLESIRL